MKRVKNFSIELICVIVRQSSHKMSDYSDLDRQIETLKRCEIIKENEVKALCAKAREILVEEGNVQRVDSPVTVSVRLSFETFAKYVTRNK